MTGRLAYDPGEVLHEVEVPQGARRNDCLTSGCNHLPAVCAKGGRVTPPDEGGEVVAFDVTNSTGICISCDSLSEAESIAKAFSSASREWHGVYDQEGYLVAEFTGRLWGVR